MIEKLSLLWSIIFYKLLEKFERSSLLDRAFINLGRTIHYGIRLCVGKKERIINQD